jgi:serine protease
MALRSRPNVSVLEWIGDIAVLKDTTQSDAGTLAGQLAGQSEIAWAQPNYLLRPDATPNDPSYNARQWNLRAIDLPRAWDISAGGSNNVIVAVIDSGVTTVPVQNIGVLTWNGSAIVSHSMPIGLSPDFDTSRFISPRDFIASVSSPSTLVVDTDSHGTHVAGTVGENTNNNLALAGIAYNARIMPLKVCRSYWDSQFARSASGQTGFTTDTQTTCPTDATIAAIRFAADNGADVINMSLGGFSPNTAMRDALAYAVSRGVFIAVSNGNDAADGNDTGYPAFYAPDIEGLMSVAATGQTNKHAIYSTTNNRTEIAAPGGDNSVGDVIWQASIRASDSTIGATGIIFPRFDRYDERGKQGTSMASPHVAGVAALLASRGITNPATIEAILRQTALDLGATGKDVQYGYGLVQPFKALFGQGIIR